MLERLVHEASPSAPDLEYLGIEATTVPQARKEAPATAAAIEEHAPGRILTLGPLALMEVRGDQKKALLADERGRLQYIDLDRSNDVLLMPTINPAGVWADAELFRDFARDVIKWATVDEPFDLPPPEFSLPVTVAELEEALKPLAKEAVLSLDVETTGLNPLTDELLSIGIGTADGPVVIVSRGLLPLDDVKDILWEMLCSDELVRVVFQNAKFDLQFLAQWWGMLPDGSGARLGDTMLLHYLLDERPVRSRYRVHGLKDQARVRYDVADYHFDFEDFQARYREGTLVDDDWDRLYQYHAMDCRITAMLWRDLLAEAAEESAGLINCHDNLLMPATLALAEAELRGIPVDADHLAREKARLERRLARRQAALRKYLDNPEFNPGSPAQFVRVIKERLGVTEAAWPGGKSHTKTKTSTGVREMRQLVDRFRVGGRWKDANLIASIMAWRADNKYLNTYVDGFLSRIGPDGRVHSNFNLGGTETGRLSSHDPNLQAIPKRPSEWGTMVPARGAFRTRDDWLFLEADYSQVELRTAAVLSGDPTLSALYRENRDLHLEVAALIFRKEMEGVNEDERYMAKAINFGILNGRSGWAISLGDEMYYAEKMLGMERWSAEEADGYVQRWMDEFPVLMAWVKAEYGNVRTRGITETVFGRRRRYYLTRKDPRSVRGMERRAVSTLVQSVASDICLTSFNRLSEALDREKARPLSIVHDSILLEVRENAVDEIAAQVKAIMEDVQVLDTAGVPFTVDLKYGRTLAASDMLKWVGRTA